MDFEYSQTFINNLIRDKSLELGSVELALAFIHNKIRSTVEKNESLIQIHDIFPHSGALENLSGKLCRCRGMIQEVESNISLYRANCSDFFGTVKEDESTMLEATLLYIIPVPGNIYFYNVQNEVIEEERAAISHEIKNQNNFFDRKRRERPQELHQHQHQEEKEQEQNKNIPEPISKQPRQEKEKTDISNFKSDLQKILNIPLYQQLNLPHPPLNNNLLTACIVTVIGHNNTEKEQLQLNDVVDFYGFIDSPSFSNSIQDDFELDEFENFSKWHSEKNLSGLLSRMTCISWKKVYSTPEHTLPLTYFENKRKFVVQQLTKTICQGDLLLAEYLLLHLCARVITHESSTPIGDIPLRVIGEFIEPKLWSLYLRDIVPVGEVLLDTSQLSDKTIRIIPQQDHSANVLRTGLLQLANGTHITLDCRAITESNSTLHEIFFSIIHKQVLPLEYPYQIHELPIDLSFLALSTSSEASVIGFLKFAVTIKWIPEYSLDAASTDRIFLNEIREYLAHVRSVRRSFDKGDSSQATHLADRLVEFSKSVPGWNNHDSFIHNNSFSMAAALMRSNAASLGREVITDNDVEHILLLEKQRITRSY